MKERYRHLDGLRGIAALIVVLHHTAIAFDFAFYTGVPSPGHNNWDARVSGLPFLLPLAGNYSVCVFFALSGYVLATSFGRTRLAPVALIVKRTVRLGVPILVVCLLSWLLLASGLNFNRQAQAITGSAWLVFGQTPQQPDFLAALRDGIYGGLLGLPHATDYDSSLWTMSIEYMGSLIMIAVFASARVFRGSRNNETVLILTFLVLGFLGHSLYLCLFAFGAAISLTDLPSRLKASASSSWLMAAVLLLGLFLGTMPYSLTRGRWLDILVMYAPLTQPAALQGAEGAWRGIAGEAFWHAVGALLTLIAVDNWPFARRLLDRPLPRFLGRISFPLYLIHVPILLSAGCGIFLILVNHRLSAPWSWAIASAAFTIIVLAGAFLWTFVIEDRTVRWSGQAAQWVDRYMRALPGFAYPGKRSP